MCGRELFDATTHYFFIASSFLPSPPQVSQSSSFFRGVILAAADFYVPSFASVYDALIKHIERYAKHTDERKTCTKYANLRCTADNSKLFQTQRR